MVLNNLFFKFGVLFSSKKKIEDTHVVSDENKYTSYH